MIRTKDLVWWSDLTVAEIKGRLKGPRQQRQLDDSLLAQELAALAAEAAAADLEDSTKAALGHIAGYLAPSATRNKCGCCARILVQQNVEPLELAIEEDAQQNFSSHHPSVSAW